MVTYERRGRLQEVRNIVIWLGNCIVKPGRWGGVVTYERWSRPKVRLYLQNKILRSCIKEWLIRNNTFRAQHTFIQRFWKFAGNKCKYTRLPGHSQSGVAYARHRKPKTCISYCAQNNWIVLYQSMDLITVAECRLSASRCVHSHFIIVSTFCQVTQLQYFLLDSFPLQTGYM